MAYRVVAVQSHFVSAPIPALLEFVLALLSCSSRATRLIHIFINQLVVPRTGIMIYDHRVCEALYESVCVTASKRLFVGIDIHAWKLPSRGRPLSYAEILRCWVKAVIKRQCAVHHVEEIQDEYEDSVSDVIAVVGRDEYYNFLKVLSSALKKHWVVVGGEVNGVV
ncbi:hypothetical protein BKA83DRAFT_4128733 [Pisolithus microcarpus]|nr:hypothetical protein BKA83DRAFT_4128733 [Pisolithus microcarpus]